MAPVTALAALLLWSLGATSSTQPSPRRALSPRAAPTCSDINAAASAKRELLAAVAPLDRGFGVGAVERMRVNALIDRLVAAGDGATEPAACFYDEGLASTAMPGPSLAGRWRLVWTDAPDITSLGSNPLARVGRIGQECDSSARTIANVIEWAPPQAVLSLPLPFDLAAESVEQRVVLRARATPERPRRVELSVEGLDVVPVRVLGRDGAGQPLRLRGPLSGRVPFGAFEIVYIDDDLRVVRTSNGNIAVNVRDEREIIDEPGLASDI